MQRQARKLIWLALLGFVLLLSASWAEQYLDPPLDAARESAAELGWVPGDNADTLGAGYGTAWVSRYAYLRLRERGGSRREVYVRLDKSLPFLGWTLTRYKLS